MPFTFAHPAAVAPIYEKVKSHVDLTALILGSMAPDFEYFIRFKPLGLIGHGVLGMLYFNLPLCILFAYIFHKIVKRQLIIHMPKPLDDFLIKNCLLPYNNWCLKSVRDFVVFSYSAIIGMVTHVLWDGFTHKGAFFVSKIAVLTTKVSILGRGIPVYKLLQHGSTALGFIIIYIWAYKKYVANKVRLQNSYEYKEYNISVKEKIMYIFTLLTISIIVVGMTGYLLKIDSIAGNIGTIIITIINGTITGIVVSSVMYKKTSSKKAMDDI